MIESAGQTIAGGSPLAPSPECSTPGDVWPCSCRCFSEDASELEVIRARERSRANHIGRTQSASAVPFPLVNGGGELGVLSCLTLTNGMNRLIG
jgi:hypothetical protein